MGGRHKPNATPKCNLQGFFERLGSLRAPVKNPTALIGEFENACVPQSFVYPKNVEIEMRLDHCNPKRSCRVLSGVFSTCRK